MSAAVPLHPATERERERLSAKFPDEYRDGFRCSFLQEHPGPRERGGFPLGFHGWHIERKNAWYCGCNAGLIDRLDIESEARRA